MIKYPAFFRYPYTNRMDKLIGILKNSSKEELIPKLEAFVEEEIYLDSPPHIMRSAVFEIASYKLNEVRKQELMDYLKENSDAPTERKEEYRP
jgi:hypothetical protein